MTSPPHRPPPAGLSPCASLDSTADLDTPQDSPLLNCKSRPAPASDEPGRRSDHVLLSAGRQRARVCCGGGALPKRLLAGKPLTATFPTDSPARPVAGNWETAATQVVQKSLDVRSTGGSQRSPQAQAGGKLFKLSSDTLLDKGLDAINNVGKLMEGFALSLDNVIGQAFEEWGTPKAAARPQPRPAQRPLASVDENTDPRAAPPAAAAAAAPKAHPAAEAWGDFPIPQQHGGGLDSAAATAISVPAKCPDAGKPAPKTAFMSKLDAASGAPGAARVPTGLSGVACEGQGQSGCPLGPLELNAACRRSCPQTRMCSGGGSAPCCCSASSRS